MAYNYEKTEDVIERRAINLSGRLGSCYDTTRDQIIGSPSLSYDEQCEKSYKSPKCRLIKGNTSESDNLLRTIGIEDELRLSLLTKTIERNGISKILDHSSHFDENTRFLYYSWIKEDVRVKIKLECSEIVRLYSPYYNVTHIVTGIRYGIDVLAVIQVLPEANIYKVDSVLEKICSQFLYNTYTNIHDVLNLLLFLDKNIDITVYSNTSLLASLNDFYELLNLIQDIKNSFLPCKPLSFMLRSISSLYQMNSRKIITYNPLPLDLIKHIEDHILQFRNLLKYANLTLIKISRRYLCDSYQLIFYQLNMQLAIASWKYIDQINYFADLIIKARSNKISDRAVAQALRENEQISLMEDINKLIQDLKGFKNQDSSIVHLAPLKLNCCDTKQYRLDQSNNTTTATNTFSDNFRNINHHCVASNSDKNTSLNAYNTTKLSADKNTEFVSSYLYKDVHNSLPGMKEVTSTTATKPDQIQHQPIYHSSSTKNRPPLSVSSPTIEKTTNILLMGETGVGKSTFINAFANYIAFNSLKQAKLNEPIVIIPVSFILTTGDNFEEKIIKFGEIDSLNNENFNDIGQSVTQHCKSYVFNIGKSDKKLRIIDTPGFGDTRGLEQDDQNIEHILHYVNNLSHLNAICFLFKPNSQRLNICFRTCFNQIFSFLDPSAKKNIIFCFTNGRSTFYTPGDTAPLLKTMLNSLSIKDIPFGKENAFCFDSEAFRYLVALRNDIPFSDAAEREYQQSWSVSVKESERFVNYIAKQTAIDLTNREWQSVKHAQFQILYMIRPLLETIRNILRNIIICENNKTTQFIELCAKSVCPKTTHCHSCKEEPKLVGDFWILHYRMHEIQDNKCTCSCSPDKHIRVNYTLEYRMVRNISDYKKEELTKILEILCTVSAKFANFLGYSKDDPFTIGLERMIDEEKYILEKHNQAHFNRKLLDKLQELKYQSNHEHITLVDIYEMIEQINKYPMIAEQMKAVKETQTKMMNQYEYEPQKI